MWRLIGFGRSAPLPCGLGGAFVLLALLLCSGMRTEASPEVSVSLPAAPWLNEALASLIIIEFEDMPLEKVCQFIQATWMVDIVLDYRVIAPPYTARNRDLAALPAASHRSEQAAHVDYVYAKYVSLQRALEVLLEPLRLIYVARGNHIWITTAERWKEDQRIEALLARQGIATLGRANRCLCAALHKRVNVEFMRLHLEHALDFLSDSFGMRFEVDRRAVLHWDKNAPGAMPGAHTVTDGVLPYVQLQDVPLYEIIDVLCRMLGLTFVVEPNHVRITSAGLL